MYLSVVITGPICLFNRGSIIACVRMCVFVRPGDAYGTVAAQRAGGVPRSCVELERRCSSKCLFTHTFKLN